jgi:pilus assembly protein CpaE
VNQDSSLYLDEQHSDSYGIDLLSIALIGPDEDRRKAVAGALARCQSGETREFFSYPASLDDVPRMLEQHYDIVIIDLDSLPEYALELVESICANSPATVMVFSEKTDAELLVRCMRAGAREFLTLPLAQSTMAEALVRASARRSAVRPAAPKKALGRLLVFLGAKGGDGVTTLACNFAVSVAQESGQSTLLIDLDLPLGDAALNLGVAAEYSTINALQNASRLDASFLSTLLVKHSSGVSVLAAPGKFPQFPASNEAIDKLISVARQEFENVIVDMGSRLDLMGTCLFKDGATIYLVIQAGIAGLRNSNRLISQYFSTEVPKLEIVLNRYQSRQGVAEEGVTKALTRPANWKIPNDYAAVRRMQHTAIPLALEDSPISRLIRQMARTACGLPATPEKGSGFSLKKISRSISAKISTSEETPAFTPPAPAPEPEKAVSAIAAPQPDAAANIPTKPVDTAPAAAVPAAETPAQTAPEDAASRTPAEEAAAGAPGSEGAPSKPAEPETRTYKGATYVRGEDGQWHLQRTPTGEVIPETPVIAWSTPAPIAYGTLLGATQLNAMASVPGTFTYNPSVGDVLPVGVNTLTVDFTPADAAAYTTAQATVQLTVTQAAPAITWPAPAPIFVRTALGAAELNATASVPGTFVYTPAAGDVLPAGVHTLSVTFTPDDAVGYTQAQASVSLTVTQATPIITWPAPASIAYGTALGANQLNATASVPGTLVYSPAAGDVLSAGVRTLSVTFTPEDAEGYTTAQATVSLTVTQATPIITWPAPAPISQGAELSSAQLNATSLVSGTFVYAPAAGEVLAEGTHTLSTTFTPADAADYAAVQASASLTVTKAAPEIVRPEPAAISRDAVLSAAPLIVEAQPEPPALTPLVEAPELAAPVAPAVPVAPVAPAKPALRKAAAKTPAQPRVKAPKKAPVKAPAKPAVEAAVVAPAEPTAEAPLKAAVAAPAITPAKVLDAAPAVTPAKVLTEAPVKAPAKPPVEIPAKAPVKAAAKAEVKAPVKAREKAPPKARAKAHAKAHATPLAEMPAAPSADVPVTAIVKAGAPKSPIEVGPGLDLMGSAVFEDGTTIYLVMQPGSAGVPNSNRLVSQFFAAGGPKPDFVINRFEPRSQGVPEGQTSTALTRPAYSPISGLIGQMARPASDLPATPEKKSSFSLKGLGRSIWSKISPAEKAPSFTQLGLKDDQENAAPAHGPTLSDLTATLPAKPVPAPPPSASFAAPTQMPFTPAQAVDRTEPAAASRAAGQSASTPKHHEPETRIYRGATYVKGADGQWHLRKPDAGEVKKETPHKAWTMPAPAASSPVPGAAEPGAKPEPLPAKAAPVEAKEPVLVPAPEQKPEPKEIPAKAPVEPPVKAAQKPALKAPAKRLAKPAPRPLKKAPAKPPVKAAQKPVAKAPAKRTAKAASKPQAKAPVKKLVKPAPKPPAKALVKKLVKAAQKLSAKAPAKRLVKPAPKPPAKTLAKRSNKKADTKLPAKAPARKPAPARKKPVSAPKRKPSKAVKPPQPAVQKPAPQPVVVQLPASEPAKLS